MKIFYLISKKKIVYIILDIVLFVVAYLISYILRFFPDLMRFRDFIHWYYFIVLIGAYLIIFYFFQIYRILWQYSNIGDVYRLGFANIIAFFIYISFFYLMKISFSRMVFILSFFFILSGTAFYRVFLRYYSYRKRKKIEISETVENKNIEQKIIIIGAGEAGRTILAEYSKLGIDRQILGFVDDDKEKKGKYFNGKIVFGGIELINQLIERYYVSQIIFAMPSANSQSIKKIVNKIQQASNHKIEIQILPSLLELGNQKSLLNELRDINISDLIGREEVTVNHNEIKNYYRNKIILITGAGGSIGSEITKQLLKFTIKQIIAVGRGEYSIYNLAKDIGEIQKNTNQKFNVIYKIADIKDFKLMDQIFNTYKPDIVFHAAAHKHVPLMEYNEYEAVSNNIFGTKNILDLSVKHRIKKFVLISTDKAVNPVNIMGTTKRAAEILALGYNKKFQLPVSIVRFGNVIGSRGSVLPLFKEQIERGGPVTITDSNITRYFMTIPEASILVINASILSDESHIFILEMGEQYKILDIAKSLITLYGLVPEKDIPIIFTGLRPGEKLYEELSYSDDLINKTEHKKILMLKDSYKNLEKSFDTITGTDLKELVHFDIVELRKWLKTVVPEAKLKNHKDNQDKFVS